MPSLTASLSLSMGVTTHMRSTKLLGLSMTLALTACASEPTSPPSAPTDASSEISATGYTVVDLGTLGSGSEAFAINNAGQIVGSYS
jgi:uncharacterized membrane protein